jgi:hypothetical protein
MKKIHKKIIGTRCFDYRFDPIQNASIFLFYEIRVHCYLSKFELDFYGYILVAFFSIFVCFQKFKKVMNLLSYFFYSIFFKVSSICFIQISFLSIFILTSIANYLVEF